MRRGDIYHVDLSPTRGHEQDGKRWVLIVSADAFNAATTPVVVPITTGGEFARSRGFAVSLSGAGTRITGVILAHQPRTLDIKARGGKFAERVPEAVMDEVLAKLATIFE